MSPKIIVGGRCSGKTTLLTEWAAWESPGEPRYIVCHTQFEVDRLWKDIKTRGLESDVRMPISLQEFDSLRRGGPQRNRYAIDNLDLILPQILSHNVVVATLTPSRILTLPE